MANEIDERIIKELKRADQLCSRNILYWLASLYDPKTGGFYYSISARDNEGFCPDLESTYQAIYLLQLGGMYETGPVPETIMPKEIQEGFVSFASSLQDKSDGYFYHPQWGKKITASRQGRDLSWAKGLIGKFGGGKYKYLLPEERIVKNRSADVEKPQPTSTPEQFTSEKKFIEYLDSMDFENCGWGAGNELNAQGAQIHAAGFSDLAREYVADKQNKETGLWGKGLNYMATNAAMKLSSRFNVKYPYPNFDKMLDSVIYIIKNEGIPIYITDVWNPLVTINQAKSTYGGISGMPEELRKKLFDALPEIIRISVDNALLFKKSDGAFGYNRLTGQKTSQGTVVSTGANESDVNATLAACTSMRSSLWALVDLKAPPIYKNEADYFMSLLMNKREDFFK